MKIAQNQIIILKQIIILLKQFPRNNFVTEKLKIEKIRMESLN